ncbi:MAG: hypothetical protein AAB570_04230, partial [Patescibacteria group bacterium]
MRPNADGARHTGQREFTNVMLVWHKAHNNSPSMSHPTQNTGKIALTARFQDSFNRCDINKTAFGGFEL